MKILVLTNSIEGIINFRMELLQQMIASGHRVTVCCPSEARVNELQAVGCGYVECDIDRRGMNALHDLNLFFRYNKILKTLAPDIVLTYTIKPNIYGGAVCRFHKTPYFANITGLGTAFHNAGLLKKLVVVLNKFALKRARKVFFENSENADVMLKAKIVKKEQVCILNGAGVNLDKFIFKKMKEREIIKFVFVGRLMREKGVNELFQALINIKTKYGSKATFDFFGNFEDMFQKEVEDLVDKKLIVFHGHVKNLNELYHDYDCLILPSYHEGMANVLLEAAACGLALITSDIHGCKEAVLDEITGYLVKKADSKDLENKIEKFINLPLENRQAMGICGRKLIEGKFDKLKIVDITVKELQNET